jgi:AcrR family transcriptional regulator
MTATRPRERQTELTRAAIRTAGRRLFAEKGFARTSVKELAAEAGVALRTVYLTFGSKHGVLIDLAYSIVDSAGSDERFAFNPDVTDPNRMLDAIARMWRNVYERSGDIIDVLRGGAGTQPELKEAFELSLGFSRIAMQGFCARLADLGVLRADRDVDEAAGHALTLASDDGHQELVHRRGWSYDRYEEWLRKALEEALVEPKRRSRQRR